ncbi:hypothetical protein A3850_013130 [Lewinella sp. 4G2]|nr:hypothetical protein A3850_013130 [Lewinella sp. 4G2]
MIAGTLSFAQRDLNLTAGYVLIEGHLEIGTEDEPYTGNAVITVNGPDEDVMGMGARVFGTMNGGGLQIHGSSAAKTTWTQIDGHAFVGATSLVTTAAMNWEVGDEIVLTPSGYLLDEAEVLTITDIKGHTINFTPALEYNHWGELQTYDGKVVDERAEVALLTRNVTIQGPESAVEDGYGAHIMIMPESGPVNVEGLQVLRMGQPGRAARYSWHWHLAGDRTGDYIRRSTVRDALQRGFVVHGTDNVLVEENVTYNVKNHAFIPAEDGNEIGNLFRGNIAIRTHRTEDGTMAFPHGRHSETASTQSEHRASAFWMRNYHNPLIGNVAAGVEDGIGFFYDRTGRSRDFNHFDHLPQAVVFQDNVAHAIGVPGRNNNAGSNVAMYGFTGHGFGLFVDNFDIGNEDVELDFSDFLAYKCDMTGVWNEETNIIFHDMILADNTSAFLTGEARIEDCLVIGKTRDTIGGENRVLRYGHERAGLYTVTQGGRKRPRFDRVKFINITEGTDRPSEAAAFTINYQLEHRPNYVRDVIFENSLAAHFTNNGAGARRIGPTMLYDEYGQLSGLGQPTLMTHTISPMVREDCMLADDLNAYLCPADKYVDIKVPKINRYRFNMPLTQADGSIIYDGGLSERYSRMRAGEETTLAWENQDAPPAEYRMGFAPTGLRVSNHIYLNVPYLQPAITMVDHLDSSIPRLASRTAVQAADRTAFFIDTDREVIYLKAYATGEGDVDGFDYVVISEGEQDIVVLEPTTGTQASEVLEAVSVYPNPVSPDSRLRFTISQATKLNVALTDVLGRKLRSLYEGAVQSGQTEVPLNIMGLPSGVYQVQMQFTDGSSKTISVTR